ncbi:MULTISPECIES: Hsp20/alpha crystallin family protein [unclassified Bradyrhizobium]|uniref:Hsp20/alpha crystallin family protein n=1 Tax=unclassified Bradyrhizobium TaxID=2631580 RepID=UPI001CD2EF7C|nr:MULTISPECIES: Hsp20/alpha crystallin family protein [unclassified Bradyrhizobium]MCA1438550.1 Hsp20/alpha crystallin family protein [Bradyrhizobium sp. BRP20]MCA1473378.1 Hsp20/alpha crystallin family protein [Bradyrhizobium sp. IC3195]MCA1502195.1 Hsp20/alpha crystallin family protein [Bradyrhizobium sp. NBAIM14]MCA1552546.1 Hsp20/alpha crystallin family protein [Bradyrhizobium sp. BRP19]
MTNETRVPVTRKASEPAFFPEAWRPLEALRNEVDRLFEDLFGGDFWRRSFPPHASLGRSVAKKVAASPAVDLSESDKAYEITAELPGLDEKDIEVQVINGGLTIKGEKKEHKEEKHKDYYLSERSYGSFARYFGLPECVEASKIEASVKNGVLRVTLPKNAEAQKPPKKIDVKAT